MAFPTSLPLPGMEEPEADPTAAAGAEPDPRDAELEELRSQQADDRAALAAAREQVRMLMENRGGEGPGHGDPPPSEADVDALIAQLPDPVQDPDGFRRGLSGLATGLVESTQRQVAQAGSVADERARAQQLVSDFVTAHPEYAGIQDLVRAEFSAEVRENFQNRVPTNTAGLVAGVEKRMESIRKALGGKAAPEPEPEPTLKPGGPAPGRAAGVSRGSAAARPPAPKAGESEVVPLSDHMRARQAESPFF